MGLGQIDGVGLVLIEQRGQRWAARIFLTRPSGGLRLAAEVVGSPACMALMSQRAIGLLSQPQGEELFLDFLRLNRCRITSVAGGAVAHRQLSAEQPANANSQLFG